MKKLRMGVVGMGMGQGHARGFFSHPGADLVALCDIDASRMQAVADEYGVSDLYTDAETMFRKGGLDAVGIAVPNKFHAPLTIAALKQGLHVLCEKPMAMTVAEARRMNAAAARAGLNLMIDFSHRFTAEAAALKRQVEAGVVGDIYFGRTVWHRNRGIPGLGGWFGIKELSGGGPLVDIGVHMLDLALWFMGYPDPVAVMGSTYDKIAVPIARRARKKFSVEDLACGMIKFDNGRRWSSSRAGPSTSRVRTGLPRLCAATRGDSLISTRPAAVGKRTCTQMSGGISIRSDSMPEPFRRLPPSTISSIALSKSGRRWRPGITASR